MLNMDLNRMARRSDVLAMACAAAREKDERRRAREDAEALAQAMRAARMPEPCHHVYEAVGCEAGGVAVQVLATKARVKMGDAMVAGLVNLVVGGRCYAAGGTEGFARVACGREVSLVIWESRGAKDRREFNFFVPARGGWGLAVKMVCVGSWMEVGVAMAEPDGAGGFVAHPVPMAKER